MTQKNIFYVKTAIPPRDLPFFPSKTILNIEILSTPPPFLKTWWEAQPHINKHTQIQKGRIYTMVSLKDFVHRF